MKQPSRNYFAEFVDLWGWPTAFVGLPLLALSVMLAIYLIWRSM